MRADPEAKPIWRVLLTQAGSDVSTGRLQIVIVFYSQTSVPLLMNQKRRKCRRRHSNRDSRSQQIIWRREREEPDRTGRSGLAQRCWMLIGGNAEEKISEKGPDEPGSGGGLAQGPLPCGDKLVSSLCVLED